MSLFRSIILEHKVVLIKMFIKRVADLKSRLHLYQFIACYMFRLFTEKNVENNKGHAVAQFVEALRYKSEGRGFDSRWCHWNFSFT